MSETRATAESLAAVVFFLSVASHEYSHVVAARLLGYDPAVEWHVFSLDDSTSRVWLPRRLPLIEGLFISVLAPLVLVVPAVAVTALAGVVFESGVAWRVALAVVLAVQALGFVLQAGPSRDDINFALRVVGRDDSWLSSGLYWTAQLLTILLCYSYVFGLGYVVRVS